MNTPTNSFHTSVASSADGARLATAFDGETFDGYTNYLYTSTNSGVSWSPSVFILDWAKSQSSLALSADGNTLLASVNGYVMVSTNGGIPWSSTCLTGACGGDTNPIAVASSADGHKLFAGFYGDIYTLQTKPSPVLNIAASDENLILSWVVPSMNFVLQENSDVTTTNWTDVTVGPTLNYTNLQYEVIVPTPRPRTMFYRLASR